MNQDTTDSRQAKKNQQNSTYFLKKKVNISLYSFGLGLCKDNLAIWGLFFEVLRVWLCVWKAPGGLNDYNHTLWPLWSIHFYNNLIFLSLGSLQAGIVLNVRFTLKRKRIIVVDFTIIFTSAKSVLNWNQNKLFLNRPIVNKNFSGREIYVVITTKYIYLGFIFWRVFRVFHAIRSDRIFRVLVKSNRGFQIIEFCISMCWVFVYYISYW